MYRTALRLGAITMLASGIAVVGTGDVQGRMLVEDQPMKMAAAEGICETGSGVAFTILALPTLSSECDDMTHILEVPKLASLLFTHDFNGEIVGVNDLQAQYEQLYGPGDYSPNVPVVFWSFRLMMGLGLASVALALAALWYTRRGRAPNQRWFSGLSLAVLPLPFLGASFGWIFTEMGRQPWVVYPNPTGSDTIQLQTLFGVSPSVSAGEVLASMITFTVVYAVLGFFWYRLMARYARLGAPTIEKPVDDVGARPLSFAY